MVFTFKNCEFDKEALYISMEKEKHKREKREESMNKIKQNKLKKNSNRKKHKKID